VRYNCSNHQELRIKRQHYNHHDNEKLS